MRKYVGLLCIVAVLAVFVASFVSAGVEPSPFRGQTKQLESVARGVYAVDMLLEGVLEGHPPDPTHPPEPVTPPNEVGIIGMLNALSMQLEVLDNRTAATINTLPYPPDSNLPEDTMEAFLMVRTNAFMVMERAEDGFETPPDDSGVVEALMQVEMYAEMIVLTVNNYISPE